LAPRHYDRAQGSFCIQVGHSRALSCHYCQHECRHVNTGAFSYLLLAATCPGWVHSSGSTVLLYSMQYCSDLSVTSHLVVHTHAPTRLLSVVAAPMLQHDVCQQ
jgi:hypothetical protein